MNELTKLKEAIMAFYPLDADAWNRVEPAITLKSFKKGHFLVNEGDKEDKIYFLVSGISRNFFVKNDKEFTIDFHFEGDFVTGYYSLITGEPSLISVELITDAQVAIMPFSLIKEGYTNSVKAANLGRVIAEMQYVKRLKKEMDLMSLSAEERYLKLMDFKPEMSKKISVKHISSYLGIQPESLSRIRKNHT
jgi:CRP-like cAMP-binding protein